MWRKLFGRKPARIEGTDQLPDGRAKKVTFGDPLAGSGVDLVLARVDGKLYAVDSRCPHEGGHIQDGPLVDGRYVRCPLHNYHFDPKAGTCVNAPCGKARLYRVEEQDGGADVYL
jgi:pyruvate oxidase